MKEKKKISKIKSIEIKIMKEIIKAKISVCFMDILVNGGCELINIEGTRYFRLSQNFLNNPEKVQLLGMRLLAIESLISKAETKEVTEFKSKVGGFLALRDIIQHPCPEEDPNGNGFGQKNTGILGLTCFGLPVSKKLVNGCILESAKECMDIVSTLAQSEGSCISYVNNIDYLNIINKYKTISINALQEIGINDICGFRIKENSAKDFFTSPNIHALLLTGRMSVKEAQDISCNKDTLIKECLENKNIFKLLFTNKLHIADLIDFYNKDSVQLNNFNRLLKNDEFLETMINEKRSVKELFNEIIPSSKDLQELHKPLPIKKPLPQKKVENRPEPKKTIKKIPRVNIGNHESQLEDLKLTMLAKKVDLLLSPVFKNNDKKCHFTTAAFLNSLVVDGFGSFKEWVSESESVKNIFNQGEQSQESPIYKLIQAAKTSQGTRESIKQVAKIFEEESQKLSK